jgi:hypothetical protein
MEHTNRGTCPECGAEIVSVVQIDDETHGWTLTVSHPPGACSAVDYIRSNTLAGTSLDFKVDPNRRRPSVN